MMPRTKLWLSIDDPNTFFVADRGPVHRLAIAEEALLMQGWPVTQGRWRALASEYTNNFKLDIAGNAFPSHVISCFLVAILFALEFKSSDPDGDLDDAIIDGDAAALAMRLFSESRRADDGK